MSASQENVSLVEHEVLFELHGNIYIFLFDNFVVWKVLCSKKTILFDTVFLLAYSLAAKLRDFTKSAASKWLDHFLQQTVLCVPVKRKVDQNTAKVFFFGIV